MPLTANMLATQEARPLAAMADRWESHPSRAAQSIALVRGVEHRWAECEVPLNAWVLRFWKKKKKRTDHSILVTTDLELNAPWIVRHYEERPEIAQDYEQMKSGGRELQNLRSTGNGESLLSVIIVGCGEALCNLF